MAALFQLRNMGNTHTMADPDDTEYYQKDDAGRKYHTRPQKEITINRGETFFSPVNLAAQDPGKFELLSTSGGVDEPYPAWSADATPATGDEGNLPAQPYETFPNAAKPPAGKAKK